MRTSGLLLVLAIASMLSAAGCTVEVSPSTCTATRRCDRHDWCNFGDDQCGAGGAEGWCEPRPDACPAIYGPVCGCDGTTYGNECEAHASGVDVAHSGPCELDPCRVHDAYGVGPCDLFLGWFWDGAGCVPVGGCYCAGLDCADGAATREECVERHDECAEPDTCGGLIGGMCEGTEWCDYPDGSMCGAADQTGVCRVRPDACPLFEAPVCGCDGMTYSNACVANAAGTDVAYDGACATDDFCGGLAGFLCEAGEWCDYPDWSYCGATDVPGTCRERPDACIEIYDPVCGCDGMTHGNACLANRDGTDVAYEGECETGGTRCGGLGPSGCTPSEWCDTPDGSICDAPGVCRPRPEICPDYHDPVCGCDGHTYGNACEAHVAGTEVAYAGECGKPADCRTEGCEPMYGCQACETPDGVGWVCIPDGAVC